jgi:hypothetical protein
MSYLQLDDDILNHPKFVRADRLAPCSAVHLWLGLMSYCKRHLTDGVVPIDMLPRVNGPVPRWRGRALEALIAVGLIERTETELRVHDYLEWNLSKTEIERKSAVRKLGRAKAAESRPSGSDRDPIAERSRPDPGGDRDPIAERSRPDPGGDRIVVSNDVIDLDARRSEPGRGRARKTETETETEICTDPPVTPPALTLEASPQIASTSSAAVGKSRKPRARTQCPNDFQPNASTLAEATSLGFKPELEQRTRREFVTWWRGDGRLKADWQATYVNWLIKTATKLGLKPPPADTPQRRLWLEQKRINEAPVVNAVPREKARAMIDAAMADLGKPAANAN